MSTTVVVYAKMMSGELIPLQVNTPIRLHDFYVQLFDVLPASLKPRDYYHLALLEEKGEREGEGEEEMGEADRYLSLQDNDILPILVTEPYSITLDFICSAFLLSNHRRYHRYHLNILLDSEIVYYKPLYITPFYLQQGQGQEDILPITPEFVIQPDGDDPELEIARIPVGAHVAHVPLHRLLDDFDCSPIICRRLVDLLRVQWELEKSYHNGSYHVDEDEDEDDERHEDEE